jgi:hypothetical protein
VLNKTPPTETKRLWLSELFSRRRGQRARCSEASPERGMSRDQPLRRVVNRHHVEHWNRLMPRI